MRPSRFLIGFLLLGVLACQGSEPGEDVQQAAEASAPKSRSNRPEDGRWRRAPATTPKLSAEQEAQLEELRSLGYLAGSETSSGASGVSRHDPARALAGYNFYVSGHRPEALLMDMDGAVLHRWRHDYLSIFPQERNGDRNPNESFWRRAYLYPDGSILAIHDGLAILKLDKDSNLIWANRNNAHHDLEVLSNGDIYTLTREAKIIPRVMEDVGVLEDFVVLLAPDGREKLKISLLEAMERSEPEHLWRPAWQRLWKIEEERGLASPPTDLFHSNSIELLDGRIAETMPQFAAGNLLLSFCHLEMLVVLDPAAQEVTWSEYGSWSLQHDPHITTRDGLLVFDNNWEKRRSRVVETNPINGEVIWQYEGSENDPFYSRTCGAAQRLSNGNTLISESDRGRAFEVTDAGEVVWEFYNPHRAGKEDQLIATLFELVRIEPGFELSWAARTSPPSRRDQTTED